jgi:RHS repeat-associated protein
LDRLTLIDYSSPSTADVRYTYDVHGNRTSMTTGVTTSYTYDELDRLLTAGAAGYRYDRDGDRTKIIYSGTTAVNYAFDPAARLASVTDWKGQMVGYSYFADGRVRTQTNVNSTTATYTYDNARRLTDVWNQSATGETISRHSYTLDALGNRMRADETLPALGLPVPSTRSLSTSYAYDHLSRLVSAVDPDVSTTYTYDPVGNRTRRLRATPRGSETTDYGYDRADRIQAAGATTYNVDANGNIVSRSGLLGPDTFVYDQANRLTQSSLAGQRIVRYSYDGDGNRTSKGVVVGLGYTLDVNRALPVVLSATGNSYVWGGNLTHARGPLGSVTVEGNAVPLQLGVVHPDGLGSVRALTSEDGSVFQTYRTDEFGVPILSDSLGASLQPFQYTGEQRDVETGFIYLRARYYAPEIGRLVGRDPFAGLTPSPQTLNRYTYARNDPTTYRDPSGLCEDP